VDLSKELKELAELREQLYAAELHEHDCKVAYMLTDEYTKFEGARSESSLITTKILMAEQYIKEMAVNEFDGVNKKPNAGLEIKAFTIAKISDEKAARQWAMKNYTPALKLDTKAIEKAGKDGLTPDGLVTVETEYRAQIASDLSGYLEV
jgi:hypothetical protein